MAISDIPEFIKVGPGDLIRADDWNGVQQQLRESLRTHHHSRPIGTPPDDGAALDDAEQIDATGIADGAITASKLAAGAVTSASIPANAITSAQLADGSVTTTKIGAAAITTAKLSFATVNRGSLSLGPGLTSEVLVQSAAPNTKTTIYFPTMVVSSSTGVAGAISDVVANIVYRQVVGVTTVDVYVRFANAGGATAGILWQVLTFAS